MAFILIPPLKFSSKDSEKFQILFNMWVLIKLSTAPSWILLFHHTNLLGVGEGLLNLFFLEYRGGQPQETLHHKCKTLPSSPSWRGLRIYLILCTFAFIFNIVTSSSGKIYPEDLKEKIINSEATLLLPKAVFFTPAFIPKL